MANRPRILVFASGTKTGGGSGFVKLVEASRNSILDAEIVGVVSNHENGGVTEKARTLGIPFVHMPAPYDARSYQRIAYESGAQWFALSGWLKLVCGMDSTHTFNIHPGPLPRFGGKGMHGHHVHEAVLAAFHRGEITHSAMSMHFVTPEFDKGPIFFSYAVQIEKGDTPEVLGARVNQWEHRFQPEMTNLVVHGKIHWDGVYPESLVVPWRNSPAL